MPVSFHSHDDIELWHTRVGAYQIPCYCLPVTVEGLRQGWHIKLAIICNPATHRKFAAEMEGAATWHTVEGWVLVDDVFRGMFTKAVGITPSYYFLKEGAQVDPRSEEIEVIQRDFDPTQPAPPARKSFVEDLFEKSGVADLSILKSLWNAICNHMAYWLIIRGRSIDFGWFKLHAFPVRANWKQILLAKHPNLTSASRILGDEDRADMIREMGVLESLQTTDLIALRGDRAEKHVGWTVEVEHTRAWDEYVASVELHRVENSTDGNDYPSWWGHTWYNLRTHAIDALLRFASQSAIPAATVGSRGPRSRSGFVEHLSAGSVRPVAVDDVPVHVVVSDSPVSLRTPDGRAIGVAPTHRMPKLPIVRLRLPNVRKTGRRGAG